jgi:secondary thiamine-phosphate synthase enzyme
VFSTTHLQVLVLTLGIRACVAGSGVKDGPPYRHGEDNSPDHVNASLVVSSVTVIVEGGRIRLGTKQGIQLCEFDGPRTRRVWDKVY